MHRAFTTLEALDEHTEQLFLHFLAEHLSDRGKARGQVVLTLAFLSLLFNMSWVVREEVGADLCMMPCTPMPLSSPARSHILADATAGAGTHRHLLGSALTPGATGPQTLF